MRARRRVGSIGFVLLFSVACGGGAGASDGGSTSTDATSVVDGGVGTTTITPLTAAAGGSATSADGIFELIVPAGSLAADTEIRITHIDPSAVPMAARGRFTSDAYEVEPEGLLFSAGAVAHWHYATIPTGVADASGGLPFVEGISVSASGSVDASGEAVVIYGTGLDVLHGLAHLSEHEFRVAATLGPILRATVPDPSQTLATSFDWSIAIDNPGAPLSLGVALLGDATDVVRPVPWVEARAQPAFGWLTPSLSPATLRTLPGLAATASLADVQVPSGSSALTSAPPASSPPQFECNAEGAGKALVGLIDASTSHHLFVYHPVGCVPGATPLRRDAILLAENYHADRSGSTLAETPGGLGLAANVIHAHDDVLAAFTDLDATTSMFTGVTTFRSNAGPSPITLEAVHPATTPGGMETIAATGTASFDGTRYTISGLVPGSPLFDPPGSFLRATGTPIGASAPVSAMVDAPMRHFEVGPIAGLFGPLSGLSTEFRPPDGAWGFVYVYVTTAGGSGASGIIRLVPHDTITLVGSTRPVPILPMAAIDALASHGLTPDQVYVGLLNEQHDSTLFPGLRAIPVQAGWTFQLPATALTGPASGGPCGDPQTATRVYLCYGGGPACTLTPDSGCAGTGQSQLVRFSPGTGSGGTLTNLSSWTIESCSAGSVVLDTVSGIPEATDVTLVLVQGGLHITIHFRFDAGAVTVSSYSLA